MVFSLIPLGNLEYDWVIKPIEIINFLPIIKNSVTTAITFLLLIISAIISSKTTHAIFFLSGLYSSVFL